MCVSVCVCMYPSVCVEAVEKQECIAVGCVPPAAVAVHGGRGSASVHAGIHTPPGCGPGDPPPGVGLETPPPGVGLEPLPQVSAWRHPALGVGLETL